MDGDLWVVGAGLHDDVTAAAGRIQVVAWELRQIGQRRRALIGEAESVLAILHEQPRPEPDGQRQLRGGQTQRLAGIHRRRIGIQPDRPVRGGLTPGSHPLGHRGPLPQHRHQIGPRIGGDIEGTEVHPVLSRRDNAGLVSTPERNRMVQFAAGVGGRGPSGQHTGPGRAGNRGAYPGGTQQRTPGKPVAVIAAR